MKTTLLIKVKESDFRKLLGGKGERALGFQGGGLKKRRAYTCPGETGRYRGQKSNKDYMVGIQKPRLRCAV